MALSKKAIFVPGVWGPFCSAVLPDYWFLGGGQSLVGGLLDHTLKTHPATAEAVKEATNGEITIQQYLELVLEEARSGKVTFYKSKH
jgi:D-ribulokinase